MIITDIESIDGCVRQDPAFRHHPPLSRVRAIVPAIERQVARRYPDYQVRWRVTALSSPEVGSIGFVYQNENLLEITRELRRLRYQVLMVDRTKDAADDAITQLGEGLLYNRRISHCILVTQDSGPPFVSFIEAIKARVRIHLLGYDYIPDSFLAKEEFPYSLLKEDISELLEETPLQTLTVQPVRPPNVRENVRKFLTDPRSVENTQHHAWIGQAITCLQEIAQDEWETRFRDLVRSIRSRWRGPSPPEQTLTDIIGVLGNKFFFKRTLFVYKKYEMELFLTTHGDTFR